LNDDVADVDANPKSHLVTGRSIRILLPYGILHFDSAFHGVYSAGEIGDKAVTRRVEDPASMRRYQPIDERMSFKPTSA